eukprot:TRINITY_DN36869_c0_g1_i1.p1 TRINITY_DN36869_c0_g1~~TRINITY_DN36869_c0_g1_i1.p1  ORF type:complete len:100 (+),score=17.98 TRINITY_DN36869_c0_g1_i1:172-471(+)
MLLRPRLLQTGWRKEEATRKINMGTAKNHLHQTEKQDIFAGLKKERTNYKWAGKTEAQKDGYHHIHTHTHTRRMLLRSLMFKQCGIRLGPFLSKMFVLQ